MDIKITYPPVSKRQKRLAILAVILRWLALIACIVCPVVNLCTGGKAWSIVVIMGVYMLWTLVLSPDLVEYNRISQFIKLVLCACVLMGLIDYFLAPGWALDVICIVAFGALVVCAVLFFSDLQRQKQNMMPMLTLILLCLIGCATGVGIWREQARWSIFVMGGIALTLLIACIGVLGKEFIRELKRRFHTI
ncbi:MAG: DUF6320 domain-containing protein [Faecousia sp.]